MGMFDDLKRKAEQYAKANPDKVEDYSDQAIERGGDLLDKTTGGKYAEHVDKAQDAADDRVGDSRDQA